MSEWIEVKREEEEKEQVKMWEPDTVGEFIQGIYIDKEEGVGQFKSNLYTIKTDEAEEIKFWGSTVLDNLMEKVPLSSEVRITFQGKKPSKTGKKAWKDYKVIYRTIE
ncbi:MAG: hypothetical protein LLF83_07710 [Methanobacterium sp.]|nr:hypothetical protein [Methanobacterium sp.]